MLRVTPDALGETLTVVFVALVLLASAELSRCQLSL